MSVLLDTNALIWLLKDDEKLGSVAAHRIDEALHSSRVLVSATSFWEVAILVAKKRIALDTGVDQWRVGALRFGIEEIPLDSESAVHSVGLTGLPADPADRFIVAMAIRMRAELVTSDARLLAWKGPLACIDARV